MFRLLERSMVELEISFRTNLVFISHFEWPRQRTQSHQI